MIEVVGGIDGKVVASSLEVEDHLVEKSAIVQGEIDGENVDQAEDSAQYQDENQAAVGMQVGFWFEAEGQGGGGLSFVLGWLVFLG